MKIFISHSSTDKKFVRTLKGDLNENGFNTWVDEDELEFGDSLLEKLSIALEESSHFLIVLSEASVNSDWVKFELEEALRTQQTNLKTKIIPVKYTESDMPPSLAKMLFADLCKETRKTEGDKVKFVTLGYDKFLDKLCACLRTKEHTLTLPEKNKIKAKLLEDQSNNVGSVSKVEFVRAIYNIKGYADSASREKYAKRIRSVKGKNKNLIISPVLLPPLLRNVFPDLSIGDTLYFSKNYQNFYEVGHFAGFRKDDISITMDSRIRNELQVSSGRRYNVEIDIQNNKFVFIPFK